MLLSYLEYLLWLRAFIMKRYKRCTECKSLRLEKHIQSGEFFETSLNKYIRIELCRFCISQAENIRVEKEEGNPKWLEDAFKKGIAKQISP